MSVCTDKTHTHTHTHTHTQKGLFFSSQRMRKRAIMQDRDLLDNNCYTPTMLHKKAAIPSHLCQQGLHKEPRFLFSPAIMRSSFSPAGMLSEIVMWSWDFHSYPEVMSLLPSYEVSMTLSRKSEFPSRPGNSMKKSSLSCWCNVRKSLLKRLKLAPQSHNIIPKMSRF